MTRFSERRMIDVGIKSTFNLYRMVGNRRGACLLTVYGTAHNAENAIFWAINPHAYAYVEKYKELARYIYNDGNSLNVAFRIEGNEPVLDVTAMGIRQDVIVSIVPLTSLVG